jgi:hypothetical protein
MKARKLPSPTPPEDGGQKALFRLPDEIRELHAAYQTNKPGVSDPEAVFHEKQQRQDEALGEILAITASLIEKKGAVTQPALVTRRLADLFDTPRMEVRLLDGCDAQPGRPLFVVADHALKDELCIGDVVVLSREGSSIIDIDNKLGRSGQNATVIEINPAHDFRYELELEGDNHISRRMDAIAWERLDPPPAVGDRVKVMGGVIYSYAPRESASRFRKNAWRDDLDITDLCGTVPRRTCSLILSRVHRWFHAETYPKRSKRFSKSDTILLYGPPGVGKTWTVTVAWSMTQQAYNNGKEQVAFLVTEGSAVEGALVGSGPAALRELRSLAKQALSQGKLPMTFINEGGSLLRSREVQGMMLDGGSSLSTLEKFLAMLSGPDEIPGIVIVDLNMEKNLDEATRQRFQCVSYPHIDQATLMDQMFRSAFDKERDLFEGPWDAIRAALMSALATPVGTVPPLRERDSGVPQPRGPLHLHLRGTGP